MILIDFIIVKGLVDTINKEKMLMSNVMVYIDVKVKHSIPGVVPGLGQEVVEDLHQLVRDQRVALAHVGGCHRHEQRQRHKLSRRSWQRTFAKISQSQRRPLYRLKVPTSTSQQC